jgi:ribonuclease HII
MPVCLSRRVGILRATMILAGIDEAGYGPLLGPLVVGCCAFELEDVDAAAPLPCLWKRLTKRVSKKRSRTGRKIHVHDSKVVYSPAGGLKELERGVLSLAICGELCCENLEGLLRSVSGHVLGELPRYAWYVPGDERFPIECDGLAVRLFANALRVEMQRTRTRLVHLAARVVLERELNRLLDATRNKASALFSTAAIHLDHLLQTYGDKGLVIFCDRQGGRDHYGSLLRLMFDQWELEIASETEGRAEYRLHRGASVVRIIFCEKAEGLCLSVAVASMLSKYLREALMTRFNAFWKQHLPDVAPTAGYYTDGERFLRDIQSKRRELGIADAELIRAR